MNGGGNEIGGMQIRQVFRQIFRTSLSVNFGPVSRQPSAWSPE